MERRGHYVSLANQHRLLVAARQYLNLVTHALDARRANKYHFERRVAEGAGTLENRGINLPSVGVTPDLHVDGIQGRLLGILHFARQHDCSCARPECRLPANKFLELLKGMIAEQSQKGARLATWDHQTIDRVKIFRLPH